VLVEQAVGLLLDFPNFYGLSACCRHVAQTLMSAVSTLMSRLFEVRANLSSPQGVRKVGRQLFENRNSQVFPAKPEVSLGPPILICCGARRQLALPFTPTASSRAATVKKRQRRFRSPRVSPSHNHPLVDRRRLLPASRFRLVSQNAPFLRLPASAFRPRTPYRPRRER